MLSVRRTYYCSMSNLHLNTATTRKRLNVLTAAPVVTRASCVSNCHLADTQFPTRATHISRLVLRYSGSAGNLCSDASIGTTQYPTATGTGPIGCTQFKCLRKNNTIISLI
jgi:hypothetical protein